MRNMVQGLNAPHEFLDIVFVLGDSVGGVYGFLDEVLLEYTHLSGCAVLRPHSGHLHVEVRLDLVEVVYFLHSLERLVTLEVRLRGVVGVIQ